MRMTIQITQIFLVSLAILGALILNGCSSNDDSSDVEIDSQLLIGSWRNQEACSDTNDGIIFFEGNQFFIEIADNSGLCIFDASCGFSQSGTYSIDGFEIMYSNVTLQNIDYTPMDELFCSVDTDGTIEERYEIEELTETTLIINRFELDDGGAFTLTGAVTYTKL